MIGVRLRPLISKHVLEMVGAKGTAIFPLGIANTIALANGNPTVAAHRLAGATVTLLEPRNHERGFRFEIAVREIVVRQRAVEGILCRDEGYRNVIEPGTCLGIIGSTVTAFPFRVPDAPVIASFPNPKHGGDDVQFPCITLYRWTGTRGYEDLGLNLIERLFLQLHGVLRKVRGSRGR